MSEDEFRAYLEKTIPEYAADNVRAGYWSEEEALERSRKAYEQLLPQGVQTEHNYLFHIQVGETREKIGMLWMKHEAPRPYGFLFEISLEEAQRGKGYGKQAMLALEEVARSLGIETVGLHVFTHNSAAMRLYQGLGYQVTSQNMVKRL
jgi:ribosomal protein S18 acetylase RimI-like enzyme